MGPQIQSSEEEAVQTLDPVDGAEVFLVVLQDSGLTREVDVVCPLAKIEKSH